MLKSQEFLSASAQWALPLGLSCFSILCLQSSGKKLEGDSFALCSNLKTKESLEWAIKEDCHMMLLHSFSFSFTAILLEPFLGLNPPCCLAFGRKRIGQTECLVLEKSSVSTSFHQATRSVKCYDGVLREWVQRGKRHNCLQCREFSDVLILSLPLWVC